MARLRYEVDPHNRLIIEEGRKRADIYRFRHLIDGRFKIGKGNMLLYHIKAPSIGIAKQWCLPHQLKFKGRWSLTQDHNLRLTLNKWRRQRIGDELTLKGEIIKVDAHSLLFAITQRTKEDVASTYILKFEGKWQADQNNRLTFRIKREKGNYDILVFDGIWEVNRKHKIIYHYERRSYAKTFSFTKVLRNKAEDRRVGGSWTRKRCSLLFNGFWNYTKRGVLTYQLDIKGKSAFNFKIGKGIVRDNAIRFEIGIGVSSPRRKLVKKDIVLYGKWRIKNGVGLIFETKYGDSHLSKMKFEAIARLINGSRIKFVLKNKKGRDLGIEFILSKTMLKGIGESFLRILRSKKEKAVYIGAGYMW